MSVNAQEVSALLNAVNNEKMNFSEVIAFIESHYTYTPVKFVNGEQHNEAGTNKGSAKVFGFALLHKLSQTDTLALFAEHYRAVKATPDGNDHTNIRNFMHYGWQGFSMPINALSNQ